MKTVILGWGSLVWEQREMPKIKGKWQSGGPIIPIEFSRISASRKNILTLVIDPKNGTEVTTKYAISSRLDLSDAICDLRTREGTVVRYIGFVDLVNGIERCNVFPKLSNHIGSWAIDNGFDSVVWTDLPPNFKEKSGNEFSINNAVKYLHSLDEDAAKDARKYIINTPQEIQTKLRQFLNNNPWLRS
ncbi:MAG: hypothetical protein ACFFD2_20020 [Promethearchaeota archaeon]